MAKLGHGNILGLNDYQIKGTATILTSKYGTRFEG